MKKVLMLLVAVFAVGSSYANETIKVENVEDFIKAIGSDRTIEVVQNTERWFYLDDVITRKGDHYEFTSYGLSIKNVTNLTITCKGEKPAKIVTKNGLHRVVEFRKCSNITLDNIELGHAFGGKSCAASVLDLYDCKRITITKTILFGSGIRGLSAYQSDNITMDKSTIISCTENAMRLVECNEVKISNSLITDNICVTNLFNIHDCFGVVFENCTITHNAVKDCMIATGDISIFNVQQSMDVEANGCNIQGNCINWLMSKKGATDLNDSRPIENKYLGLYKP